MDVQLPARVGAVPLPTSTSLAAIYQGLLVGASVNGRVLKPVAAEWPDRRGAVPARAPANRAGRLCGSGRAASRPSPPPGRPGGAVDLKTWPKGLSPRVSTGTANVRLPD